MEDFFMKNVMDVLFINPGSAILFKSYLHHKVTPVTKGERKSLTYFMEGPAFI